MGIRVIIIKQIVFVAVCGAVEPGRTFALLPNLAIVGLTNKNFTFLLFGELLNLPLPGL